MPAIRSPRDLLRDPLIVFFVLVLVGPLVLRRAPAESQLARWLLDGSASVLEAVPYVVAMGLVAVLVVGFVLGVTAPPLASLDGEEDADGGGQPVLDPERPRLWALYVASRRGVGRTWKVAHRTERRVGFTLLVTVGVWLRGALLRLFVLQPPVAESASVTVAPPVAGDTLTVVVDGGWRWLLPVDELRPDDVAALERWATHGEHLSFEAQRRGELLSSAVLSSAGSSVQVLGRWPAVVPVDVAPPDVG